jgi:hypothetical protein
MTALLHLAALVGATLIVVRGAIFGPLQRLYPPLFRCCQCAGFWVGALAGGAAIVPVGHGRVIDAVVVGAATSFLALLVDAWFLQLLGNPDDEEEKT